MFVRKTKLIIESLSDSTSLLEKTHTHTRRGRKVAIPTRAGSGAYSLADPRGIGLRASVCAGPASIRLEPGGGGGGGSALPPPPYPSGEPPSARGGLLPAALALFSPILDLALLSGGAGL